MEHGEINQIKEAIENSLSPGSQTFEHALYRMYKDGRITREEALTNADSATNLLWLINNEGVQKARTLGAAPSTSKPMQTISSDDPSFSQFRIGMEDSTVV